jgi:hypothetical protein
MKAVSNCQHEASEAMPYPPDAPEKIREKLLTGTLPRTPRARMWAGNGAGEPCAGCDQPIEPDQVEYEFGNGALIRMHLGCAALWEKERREAAGP